MGGGYKFTNSLHEQELKIGLVVSYKIHSKNQTFFSKQEMQENGLQTSLKYTLFSKTLKQNLFLCTHSKVLELDWALSQSSINSTVFCLIKQNVLPLEVFSKIGSLKKSWQFIGKHLWYHAACNFLKTDSINMFFTEFWELFRYCS